MSYIRGRGNDDVHTNYSSTFSLVFLFFVFLVKKNKRKRKIISNVFLTPWVDLFCHLKFIKMNRTQAFIYGYTYTVLHLSLDTLNRTFVIYFSDNFWFCGCFTTYNITVHYNPSRWLFFWNFKTKPTSVCTLTYIVVGYHSFGNFQYTFKQNRYF